VGIMAGVSEQQVRAWVERSCAEQQIAVAVTDPATLSRIGALLGGTGGAAPAGAPPPAPDLQPPDRLHAVRIEPSGTRRGVGLHDCVGE
jgi:hypothetical protein